MQQLSRLETEANPDAVAFSQDGRLLATGDTGGLVSIWNSQDGALLRRIKTGDASIGGLAFTPDGQRLAAGTTGITIIDLQVHQKLLKIPAGDWVWHLEFSPDGKWMAI